MHEGDQLLLRSPGGREPAAKLGEPVVRRREERSDDHRLLVGEVVREDAGREPALAGDVAHGRGLEAVSDDHAARGLAHLAPAPLGALGRRRVRGAHRSDLNVSVRTAIAAAMSASSESSSGQWLAPPFRLRTKSIPASTPAAARTPASWPAPDVISAIGTPSPPAAVRTARRTRSDSSTGSERQPRTASTPQRLPTATSAATAGTAATSRSSASTVGARTSTVARTRPGMTFAAAPATVHVADGGDGAGDLEGPLAQAHRQLRARGERVVAVVHRHRPRVAGRAAEGHGEAGHPDDGGDVAEGRAGRVEDRALLDVRLDVGRRGRHVDRGAGQPERGERLGCRDAGGVALGQVVAAGPARDAAAAEAPAGRTASPPRRGRRRRPAGPRAGRPTTSATASSAATTPSAPSKRPPDGTVSRCEPDQISAPAAAPPGRAYRLPAASRETAMPASSHQPATSAWACVLGGAQAGPGDAAVVAHGADPGEEVEPLHRPLGARDAGGRRHAASSIDSAIIMVVMD